MTDVELVARWEQAAPGRDHREQIIAFGRALLAAEREQNEALCWKIYSETKRFSCTPQYWLGQVAAAIRQRSAVSTPSAQSIVGE